MSLVFVTIIFVIIIIHIYFICSLIHFFRLSTFIYFILSIISKKILFEIFSFPLELYFLSQRAC